MPLERIIKNQGKGQLAIWHLTESLEELSKLIVLSSKDADSFDGFRLDKRKKEWICSRLILKQLLGHYPDIEYTSNGKPFLKNNSLHISISHTNNFVAVSLSDSPTALDIELCSPRVEKAASRFMHEEEWKFVQSDKISYLTIIWCAKETLYKYFDEYGVVFKKHFRIKKFDIESSSSFQSHCNFKDYDKDLELHYEVTSNYILVYHLK